MRFPSPASIYTLTEGVRAAAELAWLVASGRRLERLPRGDGHPVLVLPGFMTTDQSTTILRRNLDRLGYQSYPWTFGRNLGPKDDLEARMVERTLEISARHDARVSLIGQSLGGIYAREIARQIPDSVRQVITLGSPFGTLDNGGTQPGVQRLFEITSGRSPEDMLEDERYRDIRQPPPVPCTAIFSKSDGIAYWRTCIEQDAPHTDNVEVRGSHCGMGMHPVILSVIAHRLVQPEGQWQRFNPSGKFGRLFRRRVFAPEVVAA